MQIVKVEVTPISNSWSFAIEVTDTATRVIYRGAVNMQSFFKALDKEQYACAVAGQQIFFLDYNKVKAIQI
jgi:hypothetical protein